MYICGVCVRRKDLMKKNKSRMYIYRIWRNVLYYDLLSCPFYLSTPCGAAHILQGDIPHHRDLITLDKLTGILKRLKRTTLTISKRCARKTKMYRNVFIFIYIIDIFLFLFNFTGFCFWCRFYISIQLFSSFFFFLTAINFIRSDRDNVSYRCNTDIFINIVFIRLCRCTIKCHWKCALAFERK